MTRLARVVVVVVVAVVVSLAPAGPAEACLWYYDTDLQGESARVSGRGPREYIEQLTDRRRHAERASAPLGPAPAPDADFKLRSDHAASLIYRGDAAEAAALLESVEQQHPGEYIVATNLGTAYELLGDNRKALQWISEGLRRNPASHAGSEWLHVRILEAKLALVANPTWLETHAILGVDFGDDRRPAKPTRWPDGQDAATTGRALEYQLRERMGFVPPPDPIIADLLADLGNVAAVSMGVEHAAAIYDLALTYRPARAALIQSRRAYVGGIERNFNWLGLLWYSPIVGGVIAGLVLFLRHRRRRARRAA